MTAADAAAAAAEIAATTAKTAQDKAVADKNTAIAAAS